MAVLEDSREQQSSGGGVFAGVKVLTLGAMMGREESMEWPMLRRQ